MTSTLAYTLISYAILSGVLSHKKKDLSCTPTKENLEYEDVSFSPRGYDLKLKGWYLPSKNSEKAIIFVHGINTNRLSSPDTLMIARDFVKNGFNVLMFDLRSCGASEGNLFSASYFERFDVLGAYDYIHQEKSIAKKQIGILGFSMGGATTVLAASEDPTMTALVIDSPFADARELVAQESAIATGLSEDLTKFFVPMVALMATYIHSIDLNFMVPEERVKAIKSPLLIIHGTSDQRLHWTNGYRIYKNAPANSEFWKVENAAHTRSYKKDPKLYIERVSKFFNQRFK